ncbi:MAG: hypothetical protein OXL96_13765 [Candidatus Poribacteria bacterium]|nr:hypothetical protein [Candidatus Poribacteria bacterium]
MKILTNVQILNVTEDRETRKCTIETNHPELGSIVADSPALHGIVDMFFDDELAESYSVLIDAATEDTVDGITPTGSKYEAEWRETYLKAERTEDEFIPARAVEVDEFLSKHAPKSSIEAAMKLLDGDCETRKDFLQKFFNSPVGPNITPGDKFKFSILVLFDMTKDEVREWFYSDAPADLSSLSKEQKAAVEYLELELDSNFEAEVTQIFWKNWNPRNFSDRRDRKYTPDQLRKIGIRPTQNGGDWIVAVEVQNA